MRTIIENTEVTLHYSFERMGRGHYKVICEAEFLDQKKTLKTVTTDSQFIDELSECDTFEEKQEKFNDKFFDIFEAMIIEEIYFIQD